MTGEKLIIDRLDLHPRNQAGAGYPGAMNTTAVKLGLQQALRQVHLLPAHMPPQAILVVRQFVSRQPFGLETIRLNQWRQQVEAQLNELARSALRPAHQHIPPQANSVRFDDEVDLLMCYTRDLLINRKAWYWDELFPSAIYPGQGDGQRLLAAWLTYPQAVPRSLVDLRPEEATQALGRLNPAQLSRLIQGLHETYALPGNPPQMRLTNMATKSWTERKKARSVPVTQRGSWQTRSTKDRVQAPAPWKPWFPADQYRQLTPQATYLLGLSHTLLKQPQLARQLSYVQQAQRWLETPGAWPQSESPGLEPDGQRDILQDLGALDNPSAWLMGESGSAPNDLPAAESPAGPLAAEDGLGLGSGTFTRLGGAIFFLNLMTRLHLPESIPALAGLNPWALLGGLVMGLLGPSADQFALDPLWSIISELSGSAPDQPWGASLPAPDKLIPEEWTDLTNRFKFTQNQAGLHDPTQWSSLADQRLSPNLAWWVQQLLPYLSQYLADILGDPDTAIETLFHQPATLYISQTHIDLLLSVEQIRIPLRRAGLDQTPGWRPEFGYIVSIHFE